MILKDTISFEQTKEEDLLPYDEVDDLFILPASIDLADGAETERDADSTDEEPVTPSRREQHPRKRVKPARYRDNEL